MSGLLHLDASANRTDESISRRLTALFAEKWWTVNGSAGYRYRDLVADPAPAPNTAYCALGRRVERHGLVPLTKVGSLIENPAEDREWASTRPLIDELLSADTVVIGAPMYNYSVPAALKAWIDRVSFPGAYVSNGEWLLRDTRVVVLSPRGGAYEAGSTRATMDFLTPYLRAYFGRQGVADQNMYFVSVDLTLAGVAPHLARHQPRAAASLAAAESEVTKLAGELAGRAT